MLTTEVTERNCKAQNDIAAIAEVALLTILYTIFLNLISIYVVYIFNLIKSNVGLC